MKSYILANLDLDISKNTTIQENTEKILDVMDTSNLEISIPMSVSTAKVVRQILFKHQEGYTHNEQCIPSRISDIRNAINIIDIEIMKASS